MADIGQKIYREQNEDELKKLLRSLSGQNSELSKQSNEYITDDIEGALNNYSYHSGLQNEVIEKKPHHLSNFLSPSKYVDQRRVDGEGEANRLSILDEENKKLERFHKLKQLLNK